jgi:hypothetical protein
MGNSAYFGDPMMTGKQYLMSIAGGALLGGTVNGIVSAANGNNFWSGNPVAQGRGIFSLNNTPKLSGSPAVPKIEGAMKQYNAKYQDPSEIKLPDKIYKYTKEFPGEWSEIRPGSDGYAYYTTDGSLGKLNSTLDLALPGYKPTYRIEIMTSDPSFNLKNIDIIRNVTGNVYGRGGGGWEILYHGTYSPSQTYQWNISTLPY